MNGEATAREVDVAPPEVERFADAEPAEDKDGWECVRELLDIVRGRQARFWEQQSST